MEDHVEKEVEIVIRLTSERVRRGWTRAELARRAGLHPSTVGAIESGRLRPYGAQLTKLAKAFGWPANASLGLTETVVGGSMFGAAGPALPDEVRNR